MQEVRAGARSWEGVRKKKRKKIPIINNWWEQSKNYRAPAIWSDHFRSAWAIGGNWIFKTSFIVNQLLCSKDCRESDSLQALDSCQKKRLTPLSALLSPGGLSPLELGKDCSFSIHQHWVGIQKFHAVLILCAWCEVWLWKFEASVSLILYQSQTPGYPDFLLGTPMTPSSGSRLCPNSLKKSRKHMFYHSVKNTTQ